MSLNFSQFPTPRLPLQSGDFVVGYQFVGAGAVPTLAQYTLAQLFSSPPVGAIVPVSNGGTGQSTLTAFDLLVGNGTLPVSSIGNGTAGGLLVSNGPSAYPAFSTSPALPAATTATTQGFLDNSTLIATDAFVKRSILAASATIPINMNVGGGGTYNFQTAGSGAQLVIFASGGVVSSIPAIAVAGTGYQVGDCLILAGGNGDAIAYVSAVSSGGVTAALVLYGGTGYTTGATLIGQALPPGSRTGALTGVLTSNATIIIPAGTYLQGGRRIGFQNNTTGAFTITVKLSNGSGGSTGTGTVLPQGTSNSTSEILYTDGQNDVWPEVLAAPNFSVAGTISAVIVSLSPFSLTAASTSVLRFSGNQATSTLQGFDGTNSYGLTLYSGNNPNVILQSNGVSTFANGLTAAAGSFTTLNASGNDALLYNNTSGQSIPNATATTVTGWTKISDRVNANFNASTGVFTAPATGEYQVSAGLLFAANTGAANSSAQVSIVANSVTVASGINVRQSATTAGQGCVVSAVVALTSGQTVVIQAMQSTGAAVALQTAAGGFNYVAINRLP